MTYRTVAAMVASASLIDREYAAIAKEGIDPPEAWQDQHRWKLAAQPGWDAAWDSALAAHPDDPDYDPGSDEGVITDGMILSAVQGLIEAERPPIVVTPGSMQTVPHTDPKVVADPLTTWAPMQFATFLDGDWTWDGGGWMGWTDPRVFVTPGTSHLLSSTSPLLVASPETPWPLDEFATLGDGEFRWDGASWVPYVSAPPPIVNPIP